MIPPMVSFSVEKWPALSYRHVLITTSRTRRVRYHALWKKEQRQSRYIAKSSQTTTDDIVLATNHPPTCLTTHLSTLYIPNHLPIHLPTNKLTHLMYLSTYLQVHCSSSSRIFQRTFHCKIPRNFATKVLILQ